MQSRAKGIADHILPLGDWLRLNPSLEAQIPALRPKYEPIFSIFPIFPSWVAAPKGTKSCRTQGDFRSFVRLFVCLFVRPPLTRPLRPQIWPLRPQIWPLRPQIQPLRPQIRPLRPQIQPLRPQTWPFRPQIRLLRPQIQILRPQTWPLRPQISYLSLNSLLSGFKSVL